MKHDHRLGFPPAADTAACVESEWEQGWSIFDDTDPYPFGLPDRVRNELHVMPPCMRQQQAHEKAATLFESGNHKLPDGTVQRTKLDDARDACAASAGAAIGRSANAAGRERGSPGLMMSAGVGVQTVAVNLRIARSEAEDLQAIIARDPEAFERLIAHMQEAAGAYLHRVLGVLTQPLRPPGEQSKPVDLAQQRVRCDPGQQSTPPEEPEPARKHDPHSHVKLGGLPTFALQPTQQAQALAAHMEQTNPLYAALQGVRKAQARVQESTTGLAALFKA